MIILMMIIGLTQCVNQSLTKHISTLILQRLLETLLRVTILLRFKLKHLLPATQESLFQLSQMISVLYKI
jgi:hypothetical protein